MKTPGLTSRLAGMEFTGRRFRWEPGVYITTLSGIDDGGELASTSLPRGGGVGIYDEGNTRDTPRIIVQTGFMYARDDYELQDRMDQFGRLLAEDDASGTYRWRRFGEKRHVTVRRHRSTSVTRRRGDDAIADYTLTLRAADQRIYGDPVTSAWAPTSAIVYRGGYPAPVVIEVRGDSPTGYVITGPRGRVVNVTRPITPDAPHRYEADDGLLYVSGVLQLEGVGRRDPIDLPYGAHSFSVNNGCELRVTYAPTWAP